MLLHNIKLLLLGIFMPQAKMRYELTLLERRKSICIKKYKRSKTYKMMQKAERDQVLSAADAKLAREKLFRCFKKFTTLLKEQCPSLTEDDMLLCICMALKLSKNVVTLLTRTSSSTLRTRRYRLRKKLSFYLYKQIAGNIQYPF